MFNVLTDKFKKEIQSQYKRRRIVVFLWAIIFLQIIFLFFISPSYIFLVYQEKDLKASETPSSTNDNADLNNSDIAKISENLNNELSFMATTMESNTFNSAVAEIISLKNHSIQLKNFTYQTVSATTSIISLMGKAFTREDLLSFSKKIESDSMFYNIDLPVSNFAKNKNIDFSMNISVHI